MGAGLDREGAIGVRRVDLERGGLDSRALGVRGVHDLDGVLVPFGPAQVHAKEHLGEVCGVVAARAGADRDDRGTVIVLAVQKGLHFELTDDVLQRGDLAARFCGSVFVVHLVRHLDENLEVVEALLDVGDALEVGLTVAEGARDLLRLLDVVPQVGGAGLLGQARDLRTQPLDVDHRLDVGEGGTQGLDVGGRIEIKHDTPD